MLAIIIHENAHILVAKTRGYELNKLTIMPYGGRVSGYTYSSYIEGIAIALAGPVSNILFAAILMAAIYLYPALENIVLELIQANIYLAFVNLFPIYPLDGAQALFLLSKKKIVVAKLIKISSYIFGAIFIAVTVLSIFYKVCVTLGIFGIFIILSTYLDKDKCLYEYIYMNAIKNKRKESGLEKITIQVSEDMSIYKMCSKIKSDRLVEFHVVDEKGNFVAIITEEKLEEILSSDKIILKVKDLVSHII